MAGQRPNLDKVRDQGPDYFVVFMRNWMERCWSGEPVQRPTFDGEILASVCSVYVVIAVAC